MVCVEQAYGPATNYIYPPKKEQLSSSALVGWLPLSIGSKAMCQNIITPNQDRCRVGGSAYPGGLSC